MEVDIPKPTWQVEIIPGQIIVSVVQPPNWFHRKMSSIIFGWKWSRIND